MRLKSTFAAPHNAVREGGFVMKSGRKIAMAALLGSTAMVVATKANAQSTDAYTGVQQTLEVVTITAEKRDTTVQTTAASISAFSGEDLQSRGITDFSTLAQSTPGVSLKSEGPSQTEVEMRGMTSSGGNSPTAGFYLDDIPLTGPAGAQNGHVVIDPSLYDLNRIEVLRGPQGTLYGSSSMGGTVRLITNQPDPSAFGASAESILSGTDGGGFNHDNNVMLNVPLVKDELALRVVGTENFTSGWIDRIVANPFPLVSTNGAQRGDVEAAPVEKQYPGSNADQLYGARASLLWRPLPNLSITPSYFFQTDRQDGISAYDSDPGTMAHYQPFDIAEPLSDKITILSLNVGYSFDDFDVTSSTAQWWRKSTQTEDSSEDFNNPDTGVTFASNNSLPNPGYYGPGGTGEVYGHEVDPSRQFSEELRVASKGDGKLTWVAGAYYSYFHSLWTFNGTTLNPSAYMDLGTFQPATTPNWFDAVSPTTLTQYALFGDATYAFTSALKADVGLRHYTNDYTFSSCISGWGSGLGAATPSCSGLIKQNDSGINPKFNLSYDVDADLMLYATIARGSRPGGGDAVYPTTGAYWSAVFAPFNYTNGKWPTSYKPDSVWSYEVGEKTELFDRRMTLNTSVYYENWNNIQLEAYPGDWALNINGKSATIYGGEVEAHATLGDGFELSASTSYTNATMDPGPHWQIVPLHRLPEIAPLTGDFILSYMCELTSKYAFTARVENSYTGQRRSLAFPYGNTLNGAYIPVGAYDLTNIRAGIQSDDSWSATLFVNNLFNKHAQLESLYQETLPSASFNRIVTNQPLTAGIDLTYSY
jgi:iron complex outermembrane recepter protein